MRDTMDNLRTPSEIVAMFGCAALMGFFGGYFLILLHHVDWTPPQLPWESTQHFLDRMAR